SGEGGEDVACETLTGTDVDEGVVVGSGRSDEAGVDEADRGEAPPFAQLEVVRDFVAELLQAIAPQEGHGDIAREVAGRHPGGVEAIPYGVPAETAVERKRIEVDLGVARLGRLQ